MSTRRRRIARLRRAARKFFPEFDRDHNNWDYETFLRVTRSPLGPQLKSILNNRRGF